MQSKKDTPSFAQLYFASQLQTTANRTDLNNHPCPVNTYINANTTLSNDTKFVKQTFCTFYSKLAEPLCFAFLNAFVYSWSTYVSTNMDNKKGLKLKKISEGYFISGASEDAQMVINTKPSVD
eukprot:2657076-Ditylum_brightwellii.AAC.1